MVLPIASPPEHMPLCTPAAAHIGLSSLKLPRRVNFEGPDMSIDICFL